MIWLIKKLIEVLLTVFFSSFKLIHVFRLFDN